MANLQRRFEADRGTRAVESAVEADACRLLKPEIKTKFLLKGFMQKDMPRVQETRLWRVV